MNTLRIVYVSFCDFGGMLHYATSLCGAMKKEAKSALVLFTNDSSSSDLKIKLFPPGRKCAILQIYNPFFYIMSAIKIRICLHPDVVHITSKSVGLGIFIAAFRCMGTKVIYTVHDPIPHEEHRNMKQRLMLRIEKCQLRASIMISNRVHVHSTIHKNELTNMYGGRFADKIYVVQHGGGATLSVINGTDIPAEVINAGSICDSLKLLFFGRIQPYKGLSMLLKALGKETFSRPITLIIAGSGKIDEDLSVVARHKTILVNRFINDSEVRALFEISDVVILPYLSATQTGIIPLAYAFDKPVISTDVGALPELVKEGETGFIIGAGHVEALRDRIARYADHTDLAREMGRRGKQFLREHISWECVAQVHKRQYDALQY